MEREDAEYFAGRRDGVADHVLQRQTEIEQLQGAFQRKGLSWPSVPAIASSPWLGPEAPPAAPSGDTSSGEE